MYNASTLVQYFSKLISQIVLNMVLANIRFLNNCNTTSRIGSQHGLNKLMFLHKWICKRLPRRQYLIHPYWNFNCSGFDTDREPISTPIEFVWCCVCRRHLWGELAKVLEFLYFHSGNIIFHVNVTLRYLLHKTHSMVTIKIHEKQWIFDSTLNPFCVINEVG